MFTLYISTGGLHYLGNIKTATIITQQPQLNLQVFGGPVLKCHFNSLNYFGALLGSQQNGAKGTEISHIHIFTHTPSLPLHQHPHRHGTFVTVDKPALTPIITTQHL